MIFALLELVFVLLRDLLALALPLVAIITEMSIAPAKPLRDRAAELAFEIYMAVPVLGTVPLVASCPEMVTSALSTNQFFWFEIRIVVFGTICVFYASKVGV